MLLKGIMGLPEDERTVTSLFYINGYSMSEMGEFLEVPVSTVKGRLHSARKKLRKRMVNMVKQTLKQHAPGEAFNERLRRILKQVPVVSFQLHRLPKKDGLRRCPESFPFPSCLRACLEYLGDDLGYEKINVSGRDWRLDTTYVYVMGTTGSAFKLSWKPGWHLDNPLISHMSEDPFEPVGKGLAAIGYEYEIIRKEPGRDNESYFRNCIIKSISDLGLAVIANGVVGPPEECLITGFDERGDVLIGWSFFQKTKDFNANKKVKELLHCYHVHQDAVGTVAEGRWYAFQFLKKIMADVTVPSSLSAAAQCYDDQHSLMWKIWKLVGGPGASAKKAKLFADTEIRKKTARLIQLAQDKQQEAAEYIEQTLKDW